MQVPSHVEYEKARSVEHALELLARFGPESRVLAGGHSLIPMMKLRLAQPETLVDINGISGLSRITVRDGELCIGALVRHAQLLASVPAGRHFPILHDAERVIADPIVRNWGSIGGSLCQADPSEDLSAAFGALRAIAVIQSPGGPRLVPVREFHLGPYETVVAPGELLTELRIPIGPEGTKGSKGSKGTNGTAGTEGARRGSAYEKVARRVGDWSVAAAGAALTLAADGTVAEVGIGLAAVGAEHFVAVKAEDFLRGQPAGETAFTEAGRIAAQHCQPAPDQRGPVDYKRHLTGELTTRALRRAAARAVAA
ncbi:MAG TPA: xanthine dehydrogenase family protein subunit M [Streptosporangiaceae bacterium]